MSDGKERKITFTADQTAELQTFERDTTPLGPDEISGRTLYTLVSPGTELNMYDGSYNRAGIAFGSFPCNPGYAASFEVEAVGSDVKDINPGDTAFCMGLHSTYQRYTREAVIPLPKGLDPVKGPFARLMNVTMSTLTTTIARPPANIVVTGLGPIGLLGALIFQRCGYNVIACDPIEARQKVARAKGLPDVRAAIPTDDKRIAGKVPLVLECSGHEQAVLDGLDVLEARGELVLVGVPMNRKTEIYAQEVLNKVFRNRVVIRTGSEWEVPRQPTAYRQNSNFGNMAGALKWLDDGSISVDDLYMVMKPQDPQAIYQDVLNKRTEKMFVILDWQ